MGKQLFCHMVIISTEFKIFKLIPHEYLFEPITSSARKVQLSVYRQQWTRAHCIDRKKEVNKGMQGRIIFTRSCSILGMLLWIPQIWWRHSTIKYSKAQNDNLKSVKAYHYYAKSHQLKVIVGKWYCIPTLLPLKISCFNQDLPWCMFQT